MVDIMGRMLPTPIALLLLSHLFSFTSAQSSSSGSTPSGTATSSSAATTWTISVGEGSNVFKPSAIQANIGDIIQFDFYPANHSVARAEYLYPCIPYEDTGIGKVGFFSGFHPVDVILNSPPTWSIRVNDSLPIFYYCTAPGACISDQMVGVINPNASVSLQAQMDAAKNSKYMLQPGEAFPSEGSASSSSAPTSSSTLSTSISPSATVAPIATSSPSPTPSHSSNGLSSGEIAGIAVAAAVITLLVAALCFFIGRSRMLKRHLVQRQSMAPSAFAGSFAPGPDNAVYHAGGITYLPVKTADLHRQSHVSENPVPPYMAMAPSGATGESPREETSERGSWRGGQSPTGEALRDTPSSPTRSNRRSVNAPGPHEMFAPMPKDG